MKERIRINLHPSDQSEARVPRVTLSLAYLVLQPSNIPVLMKYGHTIVVLMPSFPEAMSSSATDSAKPTAANLLAQ